MIPSVLLGIIGYVSWVVTHTVVGKLSHCGTDDDVIDAIIAFVY